MTLNEARLLVAGDVVWWDDPDAGSCSRLYTIKEIEVKGNIVSIMDRDDACLECYAGELSLPVDRNYSVEVCWTVTGRVTVVAYSKDHAVQMAVDAPLPKSSTYIPDSCVVVDKRLDVKEIQP